MLVSVTLMVKNTESATMRPPGLWEDISLARTMRLQANFFVMTFTLKERI